jgi:hypothetical protein
MIASWAAVQGEEEHDLEHREPRHPPDEAVGARRDVVVDDHDQGADERGGHRVRAEELRRPGELRAVGDAKERLSDQPEDGAREAASH